MNEETFVSLLKEQEGRLLRIAEAILGQEADAWDALQAAVEQAWSKRRDLRGGPASFPAWIRRILVNCSLNMLRTKKRTMPMDPGELPGRNTFTLPNEDFEVRAVWNVVKNLDAGHRQVIALRYLADLSVAEIADQLGIPQGTVKSRINRALANLRRNLKEDEQRSTAP